MIDTHAHLLCFDNYEDIVDNMGEDNLELIVNIGTTLEDSKEGIEIAEKYKNVYATVAIYPEYATDVTEADLEELKKIAQHNKVVAIGEIGLDYHREEYDAESQKRIFIRQLEIANELNLPFCIHCRNAAEDVYEILKTHKHLIRHSGLMHCFSETAEYAKKFVELGMYISFSGNITYNKKMDLSFVRDLPIDRIVAETDAPYLTPVPFRGKQNQPKYVKYVIEKLASELGLSFKQMEKITSKNAKRFYFKVK
ncbi:MAG: TatD family hydrolase [Clostridia bacterium]|nr:TatD family hydrolase [Clostridia bacterium]